MSASNPTPASLGFRMPAEFEPHAATWLTWPHNLNSWPDAFEPIPAVWVEMVAALKDEPVHILVNDDEARAQAAAGLERRGVALANVFFHLIPSNDAWMRDHGPTFVVRKTETRTELAGVDWIYNAWGGKYPPWEQDAKIAASICDLLGVQRFAPGIVMEGGAIDVNGSGTLLTTESCLLNPNRNPHLNRAEIEQVLRDYLGVRNILWLGEGIAGDDTDGHVDDLSRFVDPTTVVTIVSDDPKDRDFEPLQENYRRLQEMEDEQGRPLRVVQLPVPSPISREGHRMPASYANFYIANRVVLVPTFKDRNDATALSTLSQLFPDRQVIGIHANDLVWGLGAFHCVTQQQPRI